MLRDGAELNEHQVDALAGTLAAITAELEGPGGAARRNGRGNGGKAEANGEPANGNGDPVLDEEDDVLAPDEEPQDWDEAEAAEDVVDEAPEDPGASRRFWFEHATGAGKTVAAVGFVEASRTGGVLILTHRRNLVDQFIGEISDRGYKERLSPPLLDGADHPYGPVTVETYQWFVRNAERVSDAYSIVICDEAHTALGEKTSACIRNWTGPVFIGMTATGALIARHVADLFPTQTSRFDLAQAARRGVIAPLRCIRIPPGPGVRTIANVPLRRGEVDQDFDQEELAALLDQEPFNVAVADLYQSRFKRVPGRRLHRRRQARQRTSPRPSATPASTLGRSRARRRSASWPRSSPPSSAARSTCSATRCCSPRAGTRPGRRSACTWRRPPRAASTSSGSAASPAATRARRRGW